MSPVPAHVLATVALGCLSVSILSTTRPPKTVAPGLLSNSDSASPGANRAVPPRTMRLPLHFEPAPKLSSAPTSFLARGKRFTAFFTATEVVMRANGQNSSGVAFRLVGANPNAVLTPHQQLAGVSNYFAGHEPQKWRTSVPHFARLRYENVYPGIDLIFYADEHRQLEYDFLVAPGPIRRPSN